ncbi:hypothetical protein AVEN_217164-1 [Araneus ventricosus]|uniref:DUF4817 domain-containing protein n=1 Tax=Araneus ventricosus TaxID=182803 RepID=A0A4Y2GNZ9_ARAVE|nr:hypothetical protein AVEN_217164-1 [Araneus ventricosus]
MQTHFAFYREMRDDSNGYYGAKTASQSRPLACVPLNRQQRSYRFLWTRKHVAWTRQQWASVLFTGDADLTKNVDATVESSVCSLPQRRFDTQVQQNFHTQYGKEPPSQPTIRAWYTSFMETDSVLYKHGAGCPSVSDANVALGYQTLSL